MRISDWSSDVCSSDLIYDRNRISIEGDTDIALSEDVAKRYEAYGWHVEVVDWTTGGTGYDEDVPALHAAINTARGITDRSEERRVGKECVRTCRSRGSP